MKTLACTATCSGHGRASHAGIIGFLALCAQISFAQPNLVSRPVGVVRIQIPAGEQKLVSIPFRPFDASINAVLQGQLSGRQAEDLSDKVFKWDPLKPGYVKAVKG